VSELKTAIDANARAFEEFKKVNDDRLQAIKDGNAAVARELEIKLSKIEGDLKAGVEARRKAEQELQNARERIEELEAKNDKPGKTVEEKLSSEYATTFQEWMRLGGKSTEHEIKLKSLEKQRLERFDVTIGTAAAGGYAVPEQIGREVERQEKLFSPVRSLVKVVQVGTSDYKELVNLRGTTGGWVGETGSRSATATSTLREQAPTHGELYAYPQVSEWSLDDMFFNVEAWLAEEIAESFAISEATSVLTGNGTNQCTGMLNSTPTLIDDFASPLRTANIYQYVASAASPDAILPDSLIDLVYKLNSRYRAGAAWIFNSVTAGAIRKLKDTTNQYLWQPGLQAGEPDRLLGYPVSIWEQMASVGANAFPVGFGNWRRAYLLVDRVGLRITRDEVTNPGYVRFYVRRREGGIVLNNNAAKFLRTT
jgi:HK97 family phage major capsid protein